MDITFTCGWCGQPLAVEESGAGQLVDCPQCGKPLEVPNQSAVLSGEQRETLESVPSPVPAPPPPHTKKCPYCAEMIQAEAIKCKHCGEFLDASRRPAIQERAASGDSGQQVLVVKPTKSRGVYIILGLLLGCLGIHNFYAGYNGKGATQLIITLILGWVIIGIVITGLWALIDICTVTVDANGDRMT